LGSGVLEGDVVEVDAGVKGKGVEGAANDSWRSVNDVENGAADDFGGLNGLDVWESCDET
jgi:hypothetical protein